MSGVEIFYAIFIIANFLLTISWTVYTIWKNFFVHHLITKSKIILILILLILNFLSVGAFILEIISFVVLTTSFEVSVLIPIWLAFSSLFIFGLTNFLFFLFPKKLIIPISQK